MSIKETVEDVRKKFKEIREEVKSTIPRPLMERHTLILKEPIMKMIKRLREKGE
jgi:hypothetical protein